MPDNQGCKDEARALSNSANTFALTFVRYLQGAFLAEGLNIHQLLLTPPLPLRLPQCLCQSPVRLTAVFSNKATKSKHMPTTRFLAKNPTKTLEPATNPRMALFYAISKYVVRSLKPFKLP